MIGRTNAGGSGGAAAGPIEKATIVVSYPRMAECLVGNGQKTYAALDISGTAAFIVDPGTWTVSATLGDDQASQSVTVTAGGWAEVTLSFWDGTLFDSGNEYTDITGGFSAVGKYQTSGNEGGYLHIHAQTGQQAAYLTNNPIDLTGFSTLQAVARAASNNMHRIIITEDRGTTSNYYTEFKSDVDIDVSLDISSCNGLYYVGFWAQMNGHVYVKKLKLE